jgi:hypothetical protein
VTDRITWVKMSSTTAANLPLELSGVPVKKTGVSGCSRKYRTSAYAHFTAHSAWDKDVNKSLGRRGVGKKKKSVVAGSLGVSRIMR